MQLIDIICTSKQIIYCYSGIFNNYLLKFEYKTIYQDIIVSITALKTKNIEEGPYYVVNPNKFKKQINNFLSEKHVETFISDYKIKLNSLNAPRYDVQIESDSNIFIYRLRKH